MDGGHQALLRRAWTEAREGNLSAVSQAKAWALREVWRDAGKGEHGLKTYVAGKLQKAGGTDPPTSAAVHLLFQKMDEDEEWFPGKSSQEKFGPDRGLTGANRAAVARSAMNMKEQGVEPTYASVIAACPKAAVNPKTKRPWNKNVIYSVFSEDCYDEDPEKKWTHKPRYSKTALTPAMEKKRLDFALLVLRWRHTGPWYYNNVVWTDICNSILPRTEKKASELALARKGKRGWGSEGCELFSQNLRGKAETLKQKSWDTIKVWWAPVLSKGKLHVEVFDASFPGEVGEGAKMLVEKVRAALNRRFQNTRKPDVVFVDRGKGFYNPNSGKITKEFKEALGTHSLTCIMGDDASGQPGNLQDVLLHETAVSWLRLRLTASTPARCWEETPVQYTSRLKRCCDDVNQNLKVDDLCNAWPKRIRKVRDLEGGRLKS